MTQYLGIIAAALLLPAVYVMGLVDGRHQIHDRLPACVKGAPEDVVVFRSQVPGAWDSCLPADDLVGDQSWADRR